MDTYFTAEELRKIFFCRNNTEIKTTGLILIKG